MTAAALILTRAADAREGAKAPIVEQCRPQHVADCRRAVAYWRRLAAQAQAAAAWQRHARVELARSVAKTERAQLGNLAAWVCIHSGAWPNGQRVAPNGEGAWNANTGNGYYGGLQMDASFERAYGPDMLMLYGGHANVWSPRDQIIVAQRAVASGRGYKPWPLTARRCGLLS